MSTAGTQQHLLDSRERNSNEPEPCLDADFFDPVANRSAQKYTPKEQIARVLWSIAAVAFRCSPRPMFAWRRWLLRAFGATLGNHTNIYPSARIYMPWNLQVGDWAAIGDEVFIYNLGPVSIGSGVALSYRAHVCAGGHDLSHPALPLIKPPVVIEDHAWVGTDAFIGPGVHIGRGAVVAARAVVVRDVPSLHIVAGNPAKQVGVRQLRRTSEQ
jgi:putative colanic acid biosynthesis acetyltransferase WcaF